VGDDRAGAAGTWTLGDHTVNRIGYGTMRLPQRGAAFEPGSPPGDRATAIRVLRRAVELGVNHIDTAAFYFSSLRSANELVSSALAPYTDDLVIVTKVGPGRDASGDWLPPARPDQLRGQVEENLRQLGREHLDVVNLRVQDAGPVDEHVGALTGLRDAGLLRHIGLSAVRPEQLAQATAITPVVCVQNPYGLGFRPQLDAFVGACAEQGVAFVPFFSIAGAGREAGAAGGDDERLLAVAGAHGVSPAQVKLAWALQRHPNVLVIPGTSDIGHLEANIAAGAVRLSPADMAVLEQVHTGATSA
jgi:pyridoxine 4-dehydrogenase